MLIIRTILTTCKDAFLCLLICSILAGMSSHRKAVLASLGAIVLLFLMGIDL